MKSFDSLHDSSDTTSEETNKEISTSAELRKLGIPELAIAAIIEAERAQARRKTRPPQGVKLHLRIREHSAAITEAYGRNFVCAMEILAVLVSAGVCKEGSAANAVGDACGKVGLGLPSFSAGKRYYDLSMIGKSQDERDQRQQALDGLSSSRRRAAAGLLETPSKDEESH